MKQINLELLRQAWSFVRQADDCILMVRKEQSCAEQELWMSRAREYQIQAELLLHTV